MNSAATVSDEELDRILADLLADLVLDGPNVPTIYRVDDAALDALVSTAPAPAPAPDDADALLDALDREVGAMGPNVPIIDTADDAALDALVSTVPTPAPEENDLVSLPVKRPVETDHLATLPVTPRPAKHMSATIRQWQEDFAARREKDREREKRLNPSKTALERARVHHGRVRGGIKVHGQFNRWQRERDAPDATWRPDSAEAIVGMTHVAFSAAIAVRSFDEILASAPTRNISAATLSLGRRPSKFVTYQGERYSASEFAALTGIPHRTVHRQMRAGVTGEEMINRREKKKHA